VIGLDPQLIDPENGDYRVTAGSPAEGYGCQIFITERVDSFQKINQPMITCLKSKNKNSIEVSGIINEDTFWQADTVKVIGDIEVSNGAILTIFAGTKIEFQDFYSINVKGSMQALGEPDNRILFTSAHPELFLPDSFFTGAWNGIRFHNTSALNEKTTFSYCDFEYSKVFGDSIKGGVLSFYNFSKARVVNCSFTQNVADYGSVIGLDYQSSPEIIDCIFTKNYAFVGGSPIYSTYSYPRLINNTMIDNYVLNEDINYRTGAVQSFISKPQITNNIIRDNVTHYFDPAQLAECKDFYTKYNNIEFGHGGEGNIDDDPLFNYSSEYPYSLLQFSPCINAGKPDTTGLFLPLSDFAGNERIHGGRIDMGAFEWQGYAVDDEQHLKKFISAHPNPFSTSTIISFTGKPNLNNPFLIKIYNIKGQLVRNLLITSSHLHSIEVVWDGMDENGNIVSEGIYLYSLFINGKMAEVRKLIFKKTYK